MRPRREPIKIYAVSRAVEIFGEAAKHIPTRLRQQYPQVPWRDVAEMRDKLSHEYFGVINRILWDTVQNDLPPLQEALQQMLSELEGPTSAR